MGHLINKGEINPEIYNKTEEEDYRTVVDDIMAYLQLRKIRAMILLNQKDMQLKHDEIEMTNLVRVHNFLKEKQIQLGKKKTIVVYPF